MLENLRRGEQAVGDGQGIDGGDSQGDQDNDQTSASTIDDIRVADDFIRLLKNATLDNAGLEENILDRLRHPLEHPPEALSPYTRLSIDVFLSITHASEATYNNVRNAIIRCFPESEVLSYHEVKNLIADLTGVVAVAHDMCINSCHAYTGPFAELEECRYCNEPRYDQDVLRRTGEKVSRQQFSTILLGPQLAAI
ncbi:hypothetical protein GGU11DRAFT_694453, partial [Lentinula aff. detonsa]